MLPFSPASSRRLGRVEWRSFIHTDLAAFTLVITRLGARLLLAKLPNGNLQIPHARESEVRGRLINASKFFGQERDTLAMTIRLPGYRGGVT
jgi:hypothetical protein